MTNDTLARLYDENVRDDWNSYANTAEKYPEALPENAVEFPSLSHLKHAVSESGSHYFDRDAIRFFNARTSNGLYSRRFFVESVRFESDPREYRVCWAYRTGPDTRYTIERLGSFDSLSKARGLARDLSAFVRGVDARRAAIAGTAVRREDRS